MFWTKGKGWYGYGAWNAPVMAPDDGGAGGGDGAGGTDGGADPGAGADPAAALYPDDQPDSANSDAGDVAEKTPPETGEGNADPAEAGDEAAEEWEPYEDDPSLTPEENAAKKLENDLKHPINQVPEDGKYDLTMPEGIEVDQPLLDAISPVFKELNLSRGHAQMLADKFIEAQTTAATKRAEEWATTISGWAEQAENDPDMGGAKWDQTKAAALSAVTRLGTPELKQYLEASGAGNHPEIIRLMAKVGAMIGEDVPAISDNPGAKGTDDLSKAMYPDDQPKR